jgi:predicted metal-binding protein
MNRDGIASEGLAAATDDVPDRTPSDPVIVSVCVTCRFTSEGGEMKPGPLLIDALRAAIAADKTDVVVRPVECLGVCKRPLTVAVSGPDGYTFVFGDLDAEVGAAALAAFVRSYRAADYGFVPWRERPAVLRRGLVARLPPAAWSPADGKPPA